jgi:competence protein ComEC
MITYIRWVAVVVLAGAGVVLALPSFSSAPQLEGGALRVVFLDVGQGDAIFIESPTGVQVLIDGGPDRSVLRGVSDELAYWDRSIDMVIATHEDRDHIGGLIDVFERYEVATFLRTENEGESVDALTLDTVAEAEDAEIIYARAGMTFDLGGGVLLEVLFPDRDPTFLESNTSSIVARLTYGDIEFLLTGDSPSSIEEYLVARGALLQSDVLKVGHHGSRTSTSEIFVATVAPQYAVVSAGRDNRYGHPHPGVLEVLSAHAVEVFSTAEQGSVTFETDGHSLIVK